MFAKLAVPAAVVSLLTSHVVGQTSLYIPGLDPQPIRVSEIGTNSNGETTWLVAPGVQSGSLSDYELFGPATLVAGPTAAVLSYDDPRISVKVEESCAISGSVAVCSAEIVTGTVTSHTSQMTETVSPIEVQPWNQWSAASDTTPAAPSMTSPPPAAAHNNAAAGALHAPCVVVLFAGILAGAISVAI